MKTIRRNIILSVVALLALSSTLKINQAPTVRTNAPLEQNCGGCHFGNVMNNSSSISLTLPTEYVPGTTYNLSSMVFDGVLMGRYGFTTTALDGSNNPAGTFIQTNPGNTSLQTAPVGGAIRQYMGHANASNSTNSWDFQWMAPPTDVGPITFYAVGVTTNSNTQTTGDRVHMNTFVLNPAVVIAPPTADFTLSDTALCIGDTLVLNDLSSGEINSYLWDFAGLTVVDSIQDSIYVLVSSSPGVKTLCLNLDGPGGSDTTCLSIEVWDRPIVDAGADTLFCEGSGGVQLNGLVSGGEPLYQFIWGCGPGLSNPNVGNPLANPTQSTTYCFMVIDDNGCMSNVDSVTVSPVPLPAPPSISFQNDTLLSSQMGMHQWYFYDTATMNVTLINGATDANWPYPDFYNLPENTGFVVVEFTDANGCMITSDVFELPYPTTINFLPVPALAVYPNPSNAYLFLQWDHNNEHTLIRLMNLNGKVLLEQTEWGTNAQINLQSLPEGLYVLEIKQAQRRSVMKIQKSH